MDDILREVRENREAYARKFNYDLEAIHRDLVEFQEQLRREGRIIVSPPPKRSSVVPGLSSSDDSLSENAAPIVPQNHSPTS
jgi:hypothetical protein